MNRSASIPGEGTQSLANPGARRLTVCSTVLGVWLAAGCGGPEAIQSYKIDKEEVRNVQGSNKRMLAAIIPRDDELWFFKLMGDDQLVTPEMETFVRVLNSVRFAASGEPSWTDPDGWETKPGGTLRFATIVKNGTPLELTVSQLANRGDLNEFVLMNVNRWRGQLSLSPIDAAQLEKDAVKVEIPTDPPVEALLFNLAGKSQAGGGPPMMSGMNRQPQPPAPRTSTSPDDVKFDLPAGWQKAENDSLSVFAFSVGEDAGSSKVTLTKMVVIPDLVRLNMNRWRGQVGLPDLTVDQMQSALVDLKFAGGTARYLNMSGAERTILGAIAARQGEAWFIKMIGPTKAVAEHEQEFKSFVESIRIGASP